jgi:3D (Asp-Asp-Asp) domain-containing protein
MPHRLILLAAVAMGLASCARSLPTYEKPIARTQFQRVRTTAYTHTESDHIEHGRKTCIGTTLCYGAVRSAAADWSRWPVGTTFRILDTGEICKVDDIGWALSGRNTIDLYKPTRAAMNAWGTRTVNIEILNWGDDREALDILRKRSKYAHVRRMVKDLEKYAASNRRTPPPVTTIAPITIAAATTVPDAGSDLRPFRQLDATTITPESDGGLRKRAGVAH